MRILSIYLAFIFREFVIAKIQKGKGVRKEVREIKRGYDTITKQGIFIIWLQILYFEHVLVGELFDTVRQYHTATETALKSIQTSNERYNHKSDKLVCLLGTHIWLSLDIKIEELNNVLQQVNEK